MSRETSTPPAETDAADVSRLAEDLRDATVSDRPLPAGDPTLLDRLLAGIDVIGPEGWSADAATPRVPVEDRGMSWQFLVDVHACLLYTSPSPRDGLLSRMPSSA